jgi:hypothetical protein
MDAYIQDDFLRGYIEAAIWTGTDESDETGGWPLDERFGFSDVALESMEKALAECRAFQEENAADLYVFREFYPRSPDGHSSDAFAGHNFWLTRNGHGVGFWDRGLPKDVGERLTKASRKAGERYIYIGDDEQLYIS